MSLKLKSRPEDFEVDELTDFPITDGPFAVYRLTKQSLGTPEAMTAIQQRWQLARHQLSYGGLKDRHAVTRQWVTIHRGPRRNLEQTNFALIYQGQAPQPFTPHDIAANRFTITLRNLTATVAKTVIDTLPVLSREGVANYFDDQRFGSVGESGEFIAAAWCRGDYERALWLMLAEPNVHDRPDDREEKQILRQYWGRWPQAKDQLPKSSRRSIVTFLCDHPTDFRRAVGLVRQDLRSLYLAAFQSYLWNDLLATEVRRYAAPESQIPMQLDQNTVPFYRHLTDEGRAALRSLQLPLPSARLHFEEDDPRLPLYEEVVAKAGLTLRELRVKYPRDSFFSKGERAAALFPEDAHADGCADDLNPGKQAVTLRFTLPRGAYATIVVKRLMAEMASD
ncbi:MAG: tRNA pseudouridine(13) synthase TruD [Planctomycetaceae bacterium]|nr:tRNA pseudouridine(13) synthase TruD [Planctomycetaceae bacterium]